MPFTSFFKCLCSMLLLCLFVSTATAGDYEDGEALYQQKDYKNAYSLLKKAANAGNADAQYRIGYMNAKGEGTPKNPKRASEWYLKSAEQGNAKAQNNLGLHYQDGNGVKKDLAQAAKWYQVAADQGNVSSLFNLAWLYKEGEGVPQDETKAFELFLKAAEKGDMQAQFNVAVRYRQGLGVKADEEKELYWYRKAAIQGHLSSQENLCALEFKAEKWDEAYGWCQMAEPKSQGSLPPFALGIIYLMGKGKHDIDNKKAFYFLNIASERGRPAADYALASMYDFGLYVKADRKKAIELYQKAADGGVVSAHRRLKQLK